MKKKKVVRYGSDKIFYRTSLLWVNLPEKYNKLAYSFE